MWYVVLRMEVTYEITFRFCSWLWRIFYFVTITLFICLMVIFWYVQITYGNDVKITCRFCSRLWRIFLVCYNYVIYLLNVVTFFDDVRNRFYFGTFELLIEITLQLRFVFVRHCNVFFITSKLSYLFVPCSYVFWWR